MSELNRNDVVKAWELPLGAVFYRQTDKSKSPLEVIEKIDNASAAKRRMIGFDPNLPKSWRNREHLRKMLRPDEWVVFLRQNEVEVVQQDERIR